MMFLLQAMALDVPGFIRLGSLRLPVYGIFAAAGLLAALWLSQRTAPRVGISENKLWDAGVFAVIAAFVASRLLLVIFDLRAFLRFPLLVLALPSLTYGGMLLTGLMVWGWLRWKRMPVLDALDAWAPCGAVLAMVMSVGHFVEGTDAGMPTRMPWGVVTPGDTVLGRVHPVEIYAAVGWLVLCLFLLRKLRGRKFSGGVVALALIVGGLLSFVLDMFRQPMETYGSSWLEPGQFVALAAMLVGIWMYKPKREPLAPLTREEVVEMLEKLVLGGGGKWDVEILEYEEFTDPLLIDIQRRFMTIQSDFPVAPKVRAYCNEEGLKAILGFAQEIRNSGEQSKKELI